MFTSLVTAFLNHRNEERKDRRQTRERLNDLRRAECIKLLASAMQLIAWPPEMQAIPDLNNAEAALLILGDSTLANAAHALAKAARAMSHQMPEFTFDKAMEAMDAFSKVSRKTLGYNEMEG